MSDRTYTVMLRPTPSKGWRKATLTVVTNPGFKVIAVLNLDEARREGLTMTTRRYAVYELEPDESGHRRFRLSKPMPAHEDPYFVLLKNDGEHDLCTCTAALKSGWCCHVDALRSHERAGNIPAPTNHQPQGV